MTNDASGPGTSGVLGTGQMYSYVGKLSGQSYQEAWNEEHSNFVLENNGEYFASYYDYSSAERSYTNSLVLPLDRG